MDKYLLNYLKQTVLILTLVVGSISFLQAQNWDKVIKAVANDRNERDFPYRGYNAFYGYSIAISGNYAVVGAKGDNLDSKAANHVFDSGAVYVLKYDGTWKILKKIISPKRYYEDNFGTSVAIKGNCIVVGAPGNSFNEKENDRISRAGAAYIFKKDVGGVDNWGFVKKIVASERFENDNFGESVVVNGNYVAVGAPKRGFVKGDILPSGGAVYIYEKDKDGIDRWGEVKEINSPTPEEEANFGYALSMSNDYLLIGSPGDKDSTGAAYLVSKDGSEENSWESIKKLTAAVGEVGGKFGYSVSLWEDYLVVGAPEESYDVQYNDFVPHSGAAYIFKKTDEGENGWHQLKKITASTCEASDYFGRSVGISEDVVVIGSPMEDHDESENNYIENSGSVYVFNKNSGGEDHWGQSEKLILPDRGQSIEFGFSIAIDGKNMVVGSPNESRDEHGSSFVGHNNGWATFFRQDQAWGGIQRTEAIIQMSQELFGRAVAIDGDYAAVGAPDEYEDANGQNPVTSVGAVYLFHKSGDSWTQIKKLVSPNRQTSKLGSFGYSVAIKGDYLIVGALGDGVGLGGSTGALFIYKRQSATDDWILIKRISHNRMVGTGLGEAVDLDGDYLVVTDPGEYLDENDSNPINNSGAAYIFGKNQGGEDNWGLVKKVVAPNRVAYSGFGVTVSLSGKYLVVGATHELSTMGVLYIFKQDQGGEDNWGIVKRMVNPDSTLHANFCVGLSISGDYALVGSSSVDEDNRYMGIFYVLEKNHGGADNWGISEIIKPPEGIGNSSFGASLHIRNDYAIAGNWNILRNGMYLGAAYIYKKSEFGWLYTKKIEPVSTREFGVYGSAVAIDGENAVVGARHEGTDADDKNFLSFSGAVYFYGSSSCVKPILLSSSNITTKAATISWAEPLTIPGEGYEYYYGTSSTAPADNVTVSGSTSSGVTSASLSGLQPGSTYYFWVRSSCSVGYTSAWVAGGSFTTEACPATIAGLTIPIEKGTYQSVNTIKEGRLTHYCDCANNLLLLTLDETGTGAVIPDNGIRVKVGGGANYYSNGVGFVTHMHGMAMFNRWWSVTPATQPAASIKVRTYYTTADYTAVNSAISSRGKAPMGSESQLFFYKVTDSSLGYFPAVSTIGTDKVVLITNGTSAGLRTWVKGTFGEDSYAEFLVSSFSGGGGGGIPSEALPVTLVSFSARKIEQETQLTWSTSAESNISYFGIERSADGKVWNKIGEEPAAGESNRLKNYTYHDARPLSGKNYYRLRTVDRDGTFALSRIEQVTFSGEVALALYPNPVSDKLYLKGVGEINSVSVINGLGQVVLQTSGFPQEGLSTTKLNSGLYSVQLIRTDGAIQYYKIVVIR